MLFTYSGLGSCTEKKRSAKLVRKAAGIMVIAAIMICGLVNTAIARTRIGAPPVIVTAPTTTKTLGSTFTIPITVSDITGDGIFAFQFNVLYNPAVIDPTGPNFGCSTGSTLAGAAGLGATCNVLPDGTLRVSVSGISPMTGSGTLINLNFTTDGAAAAGNASLLAFDSMFFFNASGLVASTPVNGLVTILVRSTAADTSVGGRVSTQAGRPISGARVSLMDAAGNVSFALTNPFGFFRFDGVQAGATYVVVVRSKRYSFQQRVVNVGEEVTALDFVAEQ